MQRFDFVNHLMQQLDFPQEAVFHYQVLFARISPALRDGLFAVTDDYMTPRAHDLKEHLARVDALATEFGENSFTLEFLFEMLSAEHLRAQYAQTGLSEDLFWDSMTDARAKLLECMEVYGLPGSFVCWWMQGLFEMDRFTLGRFQFEHAIHTGEDFTLPCGITVRKGDRVCGMHIPSHGASLTDEIRADSYRRAFEFYSKETNGAPVIVQCESWLLHESCRQSFPENSNTGCFIRDFFLVESVDNNSFESWRVFGKNGFLPPEQWQEDTAMQRAMKAWVLSGKPTGYGLGYLVLADGRNVTHIKDDFK